MVVVKGLQFEGNKHTNLIEPEVSQRISKWLVRRKAKTASLKSPTFAYIHIHIHIHIHIPIPIPVPIPIPISIPIRIPIPIPIPIPIRIHIHIHIHIHIRIRIRICIRILIRIHIRIHIHIHIHIHVYTWNQTYLDKEVHQWVGSTDPFPITMYVTLVFIGSEGGGQKASPDTTAGVQKLMLKIVFQTLGL